MWKEARLSRIMMCLSGHDIDMDVDVDICKVCDNYGSYSIHYVCHLFISIYMGDVNKCGQLNNGCKRLNVELVGTECCT
jgi:hypothetical protein